MPGRERVSASVRDHVTLCGGVCKHVNRTYVLCVTGFDCVPFSPMCEYVRMYVCICIHVGSYEQGIAATTVQATRNVYRARNPSFFIFFPPRSFFSSFFFFFFFFVVVASRCFSLPTIPKEILSGPPPYKLPVFGAGTGDGESFRSPLCIGFSRKGSVCNIQFDDRESAERRLYTPRYQTILFAETFTPPPPLLFRG